MTNPGWAAAIACAVLLVFLNSVVWMVVSMAAEGNRSAMAGIRLAPLMTSDETWRTGHRTAKVAMRPVLVVAVLLAVGSVAMQPWPVAYIVVLGLSLVATIGSVLWGAVMAVRAVKPSRQVSP